MNGTGDTDRRQNKHAKARKPKATLAKATKAMAQPSGPPMAPRAGQPEIELINQLNSRLTELDSTAIAELIEKQRAAAQLIEKFTSPSSNIKRTEARVVSVEIISESVQMEDRLTEAREEKIQRRKFAMYRIRWAYFGLTSTTAACISAVALVPSSDVRLVAMGLGGASLTALGGLLRKEYKKKR